MIATIRTVTDKPIKYLILTHNHPNHAHGAIGFRRLGGVRVIGHEGALKYINSDRIQHSVAYRKTFIERDIAGFEPVRPDVLVRGSASPNTASAFARVPSMCTTPDHTIPMAIWWFIRWRIRPSGYPTWPSTGA
jgi:glyoxylase-like metal-dependent hydrolase (beta-lactamase superfamily II)